MSKLRALEVAADGARLHVVDGSEPAVALRPVALMGDAHRVRSITLGGRVVGDLYESADARFAMLDRLVPPEPGEARSEQARRVFEMMEAALAQVGMPFTRTVRTWFYLDDILSWYDEFNAVRTRFFRERGVFDALVPASTGVGGPNSAGAALFARSLAFEPLTDRARVESVASPLQCPAPAYGSSFSRAVEIAVPGERRLFVSGTASIAPEGHTVHVGDLGAQIECSLRVVEAILASREMAWPDVTRGVAYVARADDLTVFESHRRDASLPSLPIVSAHHEICRGDLLFEIEVDASTCR